MRAEKRGMMSQAVPHDTTVVPTRAADLVCASYQPRPTVAVCLSGHARTLVQPLVYRTIKGHLVDAFGGDATVVADLKLRDESGEGPLAHVDADEARVRHALAHIGVADRDTIIRATGPPDTVPPCNATTGMVRFSPTTPQKDERGIMVWPTHMGSSRAYYSLLGQLRNRANCHALIERAEASRGGGRFDVVMVSRPDLVWSFPVRPYCLWNLSQPLRKHDWFYFLPRREMDAALQRPLETMLGCSRRWDTQHGYVERHLAELFACPNDEDGLLSAHVTKGAALRGRPKRAQEAMCFEISRWAGMQRGKHVKNKPDDPLRRYLGVELCPRLIHRNPWANVGRHGSGGGSSSNNSKVPHRTIAALPPPSPRRFPAFGPRLLQQHTEDEDEIAAPCDEPRELRARCGLSFAQYEQDLRQWRGRRALFFEYSGPTVPSGLGIALPNLFLLFEICWRLRRFCYISLFDLKLHKAMSYRAFDGMRGGALSWAPPDGKERALYDETTTRLVELNKTSGNKGPLAHPVVDHAVWLLSKSGRANASLLHVRTHGTLRFDLSRELPLRNLTCLFRFVSEPTPQVASAIERMATSGGNLASQAARPTVTTVTTVTTAASAATTTIQLRTGYADLEDRLLRELRGERARRASASAALVRAAAGASSSSLPSAPTAGASSSSLPSPPAREDTRERTAELARWLALACPELPRELSQRAHLDVLTDAPAVRALIRHGTNGLHDGDAAALNTTRSWASPTAATQRAFAELHRASLSRTLYIGNSNFAVPLVARSVCVRRVLPLGGASSPCRHFGAVFSRGFFGLVNFYVGRAVRYYGRVQGDLRKLAARSNLIHPCLNQSAHACAASYVAAVTASRLEEAHAATQCRKVLPKRDCKMEVAPRAAAT